jgi:hypothetical protein
MTTTTLSAPSRTLEQRMDALARANRIRVARAQAKKRWKGGDVKAALDTIREPPLDFETMKLWDVLLSLPAFGKTKVNRVHRSLNISPSKTLGGLTERQRTLVVEWLTAR